MLKEKKGLNRMSKASLLLVGSELFDFDRKDTNGKIVFDFLKSRNFEIAHFQIVEDNIRSIRSAFLNASEVSDVIITSGGIGPTGDDLTREGLSKALKKNLIFDEKWFYEIEKKLIVRDKKPKEFEKKMAFVPEGGEIIPNKYGLAGGVYLKEKGKVYFLLPGVPSEFKEMFKNFVTKKIDEKFKIKPKKELKFYLSGIRESEIQEYLKKIDKKGGGSYSILPHFGVIELKFLFESDKLRKETQKEFSQLYGSNIVSNNGEGLIEKISKELKKRKYFLSIAESITGGTLSKKIVSYPGASKFYKGSVTAYSNEAKIDILGVPEEYLRKFGAVSEQTALAMVRGARARFLSQCAIATTGIAGPKGGTVEKPVGLVYIALSKPEREKCFKYVFPFSREGVIEMTSNYALFRFLKFLRDED